MNLFTEHSQRQGITYLEHLEFALSIAHRLFLCTVAFSLHAIFPFVKIRQEVDLEQTAHFINEKNAWIENMKRKNNIEPFRPSYLQNINKSSG